MTELYYDEPLDEGYWESLGESDLGPPPALGQDPFSEHEHSQPIGGSRYEAGWLKTRGGVEFIDVFVGEVPGSDDTHALVFLYEAAPDRYGVGICPPKTVEGGRFIVEDVDYDTAKRKAERAAMAMSVDAGLNADWRHAPASPGQIRLLDKLRLWWGSDDGQVLTKGQASDLLNVHFASKTLDPAFGKGSS